MLTLIGLLAATIAGSVQDTVGHADLPTGADSVAIAVHDTVPHRRRAVVYSDAYGTRLTIHRYASYAMLPVFGAQYLLGDRLLRQKEELFAGTRSADIDAGLRRTHAVVAAGLASLFLVNTTTGLWNMYEARNDPAGRGLRNAHALTMLAADAGFVAVAVLGAQATDRAPVDARRHRTVALGSMALSTGGAAMMWLFNRR
jgi:hypothetical protein